MKKGIILTATLLITSVMVFAQQLKNPNGDVLATIEASGVIKDGINILQGQFMVNGDIQDANGDVIGKIEGDEFKDMNGAVLGSINASGEVFDMTNLKIGEVPNTTSIKNGNGQVIGTASSATDKKRLAAYYIFYFNNNY